MKEWPTKEELQELQKTEYSRAIRFDQEPDPICECGEPGWCCRCKELAEDIGFWADGTSFNKEEEQ